MQAAAAHHHPTDRRVLRFDATAYLIQHWGRKQPASNTVMRTTLTLDDDVAMRLERLRGPGQGFETLLNAALRAGLDELERGSGGAGAHFSTQSFRLGATTANLDDIAAVLAIAESEDWR